MDSERLIAGRYRLHHVLGSGSMGTVWAAHDEVLRRAVAVKEVFQPSGMAGGEAAVLRERTLREARAAAQLAHPNLVTIYDVVQVDGDPYVVMELVPSESLAEVVRRCGPLTAEQGAVVAHAVASGLDAAHRAGITHRDVKPGNVLVAADGRVKLTDFGIARNMAEATMTSRGIALGTPAFIAPEIATDGVVTQAVDQWSLGATLFAAMTGQLPYEGDNPLQTINQVVHGDVPSTDVCGELAEVVGGLMRKDPAERLPLSEVRRLVRPLLPDADGFPFEEGAEPRPVVEVVRPEPVRLRSAEPAPDAPLAADPGPLPFLLSGGSSGRSGPHEVTDHPHEYGADYGEDYGADYDEGYDFPDAPPARRSGLATVLLALAATVLFAVGAGSGFVLTLAAAGRPLLPPAASSAERTPSAPATVTVSLVRRELRAATKEGDRGAGFTIDVGSDWTSFVTQSGNGGVANSTAVLLVDPSGSWQVTVERFPDFFPGLSVDNYLDLVAGRWGGDNYFPGQEKQPTEPLPNAGRDGAVQYSYNTVEHPRDGQSRAGTGSAQTRRSHYARVLPRGNDLWVVEVVFPTEQEEQGREQLFDSIAPTLTVIG
ncbi:MULTISPECIES: serine/threonine-protein kinase [Actinosynnema]|uniref:non-specific serine/threonine protein kinase n=1 Tax=Actinosynnema pretiosum TaxID=42197 RepID=A0A290ZE30_9PSEU|nr:serine/threonine-protein kinase [Actinosynnema pretiosum]ATE57267.1 serine/threonine protein kinase [Actinosynnema pretiosum]